MLRGLWQLLVGFRHKSGRNRIYYSLDKPARLADLVESSLIVSGWAIDLERGIAPQVRVSVGGQSYRPA